MIKALKTYLLLFVISSLYSQQIKGIHAQFERKIIEDTSIDSISGEIYIAFPNLVYIRISNPLDQIMVLTEDEMKIYYPNRNVGFRYISSSLLSTGWLVALCRGRLDDLLPRLNLKLFETKTHGETTVTIWKPIKRKSRKKFAIEVHKSGGLVRKIVTMAKKDTLAINIYKKYELVSKNFYFPILIVNDTYSGKAITREIIKLSNPEVLERIPQDIVDFQFPPDARIKIYKY